MAEIKYSVIGAGSSENNPVTVFAGCDDTSVLICWTGRKSCKELCNTYYTDSQYCDTVAIEPTTGELVWKPEDGKEIKVYYKIIKDCPAPSPSSCDYSCSNFSVYTVPRTIEINSLDSSIEIHYQYILTCENNNCNCDSLIISDDDSRGDVHEVTDGDYVGSRENYSKTITKKISELTPQGNPLTAYTYTIDKKDIGYDGCSGTAKVYVSSDGKCTPGTTAEISFSSNPEVVPGLPSSGTNVTVFIHFKKITIDEECNEKVVTGVGKIPWLVKCKSGASDCDCNALTIGGSSTNTNQGEISNNGSNNDRYRCCQDHMESSAFTLNQIRSAIGVGDDVKIYYNGAEVSSDGVTFSILQKGKHTEECSGTCEEKTTYCVDSSSVKVLYETVYNSNDWTESGTVPSTGGRIKVTWTYSSHTLTDRCTEYDTSGKTWEEIIVIGGCDERPTDCKPEYNKVSAYSQSQGAIVEEEYDNMTYGDCEICDSECCYDDNGGKCVILFKEQTPGCTTAPSTTVWDAEEKRNITYNKIRYEFKQECKPPEPPECDCGALTIE